MPRMMPMSVMQGIGFRQLMKRKANPKLAIHWLQQSIHVLSVLVAHTKPSVLKARAKLH